MCIGLPMRVIEAGEFSALCAYRGETRRVDTRLVGRPPPGAWLLVFLDAAREILDPERAGEVDEALRLLEWVMAGGDPSMAPASTFPEREPTLPPHLRTAS